MGAQSLLQHVKNHLINKYGAKALADPEMAPEFRLSRNLDMNLLIASLEKLLGIEITRPSSGQFVFSPQRQESLYVLRWAYACHPSGVFVFVCVCLHLLVCACF